MSEKKPGLNYARYYERWNDTGPETEARRLDYFQRLLGSLRPDDLSQPVLDVGCGCGHLLEVLRRSGCSSLLGIDRDPDLVAATRARGLNAESVDDAVDYLLGAAGRYELICACDVLEHFPRERQLTFVRALAGALRPGGQLLLSVPNANSAIAARWRYNDLTHYSSFTECSLDHVLHLGGLQEISIGPFELMAPPPRPWLPSLWQARWWMLKSMRCLQRLEMVLEFGRREGSVIPLSPNLRATARTALS